MLPRGGPDIVHRGVRIETELDMSQALTRKVAEGVDV
jgi:hypothetical protein